jgi:hypothetical protein
MASYLMLSGSLKGSDQHIGKKRTPGQEHLPGSLKLDAHFGTAGPARLNCRHPDRLGRASHCQLHLIGAEHWAFSGLAKLVMGSVGHGWREC